MRKIMERLLFIKLEGYVFSIDKSVSLGFGLRRTNNCEPIWFHLNTAFLNAQSETNGSSDIMINFIKHKSK